jgi:hypothetical protein
MQTRVRTSARAAEIRAASAQATKQQAVVDAWEALELSSAADMQAEKAAEARNERADNARMEADTRAEAAREVERRLFEDAWKARMATAEGEAERRLAHEKLLDQRLW